MASLLFFLACWLIFNFAPSYQERQERREGYDRPWTIGRWIRFAFKLAFNTILCAFLWLSLAMITGIT